MKQLFNLKKSNRAYNESLKRFEEEMFNIFEAFSSPILTHSSLWIDTIPKRLLDVIKTDRIVLLHQGKLPVPNSELVAFLMTRTFEAPMNSEWVDIYTHYSCKVCQEHWNEDHWNSVNAPRQLTEYQIKQLVLPLKNHIYNERRKIYKQRIRENELAKKVQTV